jgi:hypothetical protein
VDGGGPEEGEEDRRLPDRQVSTKGTEKAKVEAVTFLTPFANFEISDSARQKLNGISDIFRFMQPLVSLHLLFDFINSLWAQMLMSAKKQVDAIEDKLTCFVAGDEVVASHVVKANQCACGSLKVIPSDPTIQSS